MKKLSLFFIVLLLAVFVSCKFNLPGGEKTPENVETKTETVKEEDGTNEDIDLKAIFDKEGKNDEQKSEGEEKKDEIVVAFDVKEYKFNEEFKIDLDKDGVDESVVLEFEKTASSSDEGVELYDAFLTINEKRLFHLGKASAGKIFITDIDAGDGSLELFTAVSDYVIYETIQCFHYKDSELKELYFSDEAGSINILNILESKSDGMISLEGEGNFSLYLGDGAEIRDLGQYITKADYMLKDDFLVYVGSPRYEKTTEQWQKEAPYYLIADGIELFDSARGNKIGDLKKGDIFYLYSVKKYNKVYDESYENFIYSEAWAEIQVDGSGKKGWIRVPKGEFYKTDLEDEYAGAYHWN